MTGDQFTEAPDTCVWAFDYCPDECNERHPEGQDPAPVPCIRGHEIDPCDGCPGWGRECGAIYRPRAAKRAMGT